MATLKAERAQINAFLALKDYNFQSQELYVPQLKKKGKHFIVQTRKELYTIKHSEAGYWKKYFKLKRGKSSQETLKGKTYNKASNNKNKMISLHTYPKS